MKVLASDFDGTIYFDDGFHQEDIDQIKEFQKAGHLFGICTGRPLKGISYFSKGFVEYDFYIVSSGALIVDKQGKILYEQCIDYSIMKDIYEHYSHDYWVCIQADGVMYKKEVSGDLSEIQVTLNSIEDLKNSHIYGLSLNAHSDDQAKRVCQKINQDYPQVNAFQNKEFIDIVKKGCSKGEGIIQLKQLFDVNEVSGIGDSYNDLPMLDVVDNAITFHSSPDEVKECADVLVDSMSEAIDYLLKDVR